MPDREKLIELLYEGVRCPGTVSSCDDCPHRSNETPCDEYSATADMLIANGVTFPVLCKDCVQYAPYEKPGKGFDGRCLIQERETNEGEFCSYGIRKVD